MNKAFAQLGYAAMTTAVAALTLGSCATKKAQQEKDNNMQIVRGDNMDDNYLIFSDAERAAVDNTNEFALNLFRTQAGMDSKVVSPVSVAYLMGLLANGASGATQAEIMKALSMDGTSLTTLNETYKGILNTASRHDSQTKVNIANCVAVNKQVTLKDNYKDAMQTLYNANVESMDFASPKALAKINAWCSRQTKGMIPKIVDQLDPTATAVLMNAVYFNGTWANVFDKNDTKTENFRGYTRDIKKVPMMHQEGKFSYTDNKDFAAVTLPYGNGTYSMTVILPAEGKSTTEIVNSLNAKTLEKMRLDMDECVVDLKLPRFSTTTETSLNSRARSLVDVPCRQGRLQQHERRANVRVGDVAEGEDRGERERHQGRCRDRCHHDHVGAPRRAAPRQLPCQPPVHLPDYGAQLQRHILHRAIHRC